MLDRMKHYHKVAGIRGVLTAAAAKISGRPRLLAVRPAGVRQAISLRVPSSDLAVYEQVFVDDEYGVETLRQPRFVIDAGANVGFASIYFATRFPQAVIVAVEPEPANFEALLHNVAGYPNIRPVRAALWSTDKQINIVDPGLGAWGFMTADPSAATDIQVGLRETGQAVAGVTVRQLMERFGMDRVDILKLDIEGAEKEVLEASHEWIDAVDALIVELHDRLKAGCSHAFDAATVQFGQRWNRGENIFKVRSNDPVFRPLAAR